MAGFMSSQFTALPHDSLEGYAKSLEAEKARAEEAERMYETLKKLHEDCTEEFRVTQNQTQRVIGELEQRLQKSDDTIRELRRTVLDQSREISEFRPNLFTPQREGILRLSLQSELDKQYQGKLRALQDDNTTLKSKVSGLTYENGALQADLESRDAEFKRQKSDLILKYDRKIDELRREKDAAAAVPPAVDIARHRQLQRDNEQLEIRVKAQQAELESTRLTENKRAQEAHASFKAQAQKISESAQKVESLKAELDVQKQQTDGLRVQLSQLSSENVQLTRRNETLQDEKLTVEFDRESLRHRLQTEVANEKSKALAEKISLRKETDALMAEIERLKGEVESAKQAVELQRGTVSAKEHETQTRLNQLAQQHAKEIALADQEKHEITSRVSKAEARVQEVEKTLQSKEEEFKEEIRRGEAITTGLRSELDSIMNRTRDYQKLQNDLTQLTHSYSSLQQDVKALVGQISAMEKTFRNLKEEKGKLEEEIVRLKNRHLQQDSLMLQRQSDNAAALEALQTSWNEKRASYVVYIKRQSEELEQQKNRVLALSGKEKELRKNQRRYKTKVRAVVAELVAAVNAGSTAHTTLLHLTKDLVAPEVYRAVVEELDQLKQKMARLKSMAVPNEVPVTAVRTGRISRLGSAKSIGDHLDRVVGGNKVALPPLPIPSDEDLRALFGRLRELGLTGVGKIPGNEIPSDAESSDADPDEV